MKIALLLHRNEELDLMVSFEIDPAACAKTMADITAIGLVSGTARLDSEVLFDLIPTSEDAIDAEFKGAELLDWLTEDSEGDVDTETAGLRTYGLGFYPSTGNMYLKCYHKHGGDFETEGFKLADLTPAESDPERERLERELAAAQDALASGDGEAKEAFNEAREALADHIAANTVTPPEAFDDIDRAFL